MAVFDCSVFDANVFDTDCTGEEEDVRPVQTTVFRQPVYSHVYEPPKPTSTEYVADGGVEYFGRALVTYPNRRGVVYAACVEIEQSARTRHAHSVTGVDSASEATLEPVGKIDVSWGCVVIARTVEYRVIQADIAKGTTVQQIAQADAEVMSILKALGVLL